MDRNQKLFAHWSFLCVKYPSKAQLHAVCIACENRAFASGVGVLSLERLPVLTVKWA